MAGVLELSHGLVGEVHLPVRFHGGGPVRLKGAGLGPLRFSYRYAALERHKSNLLLSGTDDLFTWRVLMPAAVLSPLSTLARSWTASSGDLTWCACSASGLATPARGDGCKSVVRGLSCSP